jgi:hypothetical protein
MFTMLQFWSAGVRDETAELRSNALKVQLAEANARAADANAKAVEAQLALEHSKTPRSLNKEQLLRIAQRIKEFAGVPFDLWVKPDPEPIAFVTQITVSLIAAGWKGVPAQDTGGLKVSGPGIPDAGIAATAVGVGIAISTDNGEGSREHAAGKALAEALIADGINVRIVINDAPKDLVHLVVGRKE